ncbi:hypothetical protein BH11PLA2_BH11PLA2_00290 [soil metagenome]
MLLASSIPMPIVYAGLIGFVLSLFVATWQQKWDCKVFFLLALRLAIGWQFFFEGMHKVNSYLVGPTETNKVFSSEPYFKVAPTAFGEIMRKKFDDPQPVINDRVKPPKPTLTVTEFKAMSPTQQAAQCPDSVIAEFDKLAENANAAIQNEITTAKKQGEKYIQSATSDELKAHYTKKLEDTLKDLDMKLNKLGEIKAEQLEAAKAKYAAWVYGAATRDGKVKQIADAAPCTAPQRLQMLETEKITIQRELNTADQKRSDGLGVVNGVDVKRVAELRTDLIAAEADLAKDANTFVADLKKEILGWDFPVKADSEGKRIDKFTMWFIAVVGGCLLLGFCTRLNCVLAAGFLVMTYLSHPPFPWYALPPGTEGNPLFINKNLIEVFALLALACYPTGRWLGLDAIVHRQFHSRNYLAAEAQAQREQLL